MYYPVSGIGLLGKKVRVLLSGVEPKTFRVETEDHSITIIVDKTDKKLLVTLQIRALQ